MENYNIFSPSTTTSASTSSNYNTFPFSLTSDLSNDFDVFDYDHNNNLSNHNQSEPLLMIMGELNKHYQPSMLGDSETIRADNVLINNTKEDIKENDRTREEFKVVIKSGNNGNKGKKGLSEKKGKKHRYAFQTRSQVDILDDGYRWRKYGQKGVKNNKFPRSYYRCTYQGCNVKKQVQRLSKDEGVVVTTYEGIHSHSIGSSTDNFEHILSQMQIYTCF